MNQTISERLDEVQRLKEEYNNHADTSGLPPELITTILIFVAQMVHDAAGSPRDILRVTHVCHHWRTIALKCSEFWSYIPLQARSPTFPDVPNPFPTRSGDKPLKVSLSITDTEGNFDTLMKDLEVILPRTSSLLVRFRNDTYSSYIEDALDSMESPAPNLESLTFKSDCFEGVSGIGPYLFNAELPCLKRLSIGQGILFDSSSACFVPTLTHLNLSFRIPSLLPDFIFALRRMPLIQVCRLADLGWASEYCDEDSGIDPSGDLVEMSHLRNLEISAHPKDIAELCSYLNIPSHADLGLMPQLDGVSVQYEDVVQEHSDDLRTLLFWVAKHHEEKHLPLATKGWVMLISWKKRQRAHQLVLAVSPYSPHNANRITVLLQVHFGSGAALDDHTDYWSAVIPGMLSQLSSSHITTIDIGSLPQPGSLDSLLVRLPALESIILSGPQAMSTIMRLSFLRDSNNSETSSSTHSSHICPAYTVAFVGTQFDHSDSLPNHFRQLQESGYRIESLGVSKCIGFNPKWVEELESLGLLVRWDRRG